MISGFTIYDPSAVMTWVLHLGSLLKNHYNEDYDGGTIPLF